MRNTISIIGIALAVALLGVAAQKRPPNYNPAKMPDTDFDCSDKIIGGYYGDAETECQMFHVCVKVPGIGVQDFRFLCPNDTAFDQENQVCDDWYNIDCAGQVSSPRAPGSRPSPTPIALGPSTTRPAVQQAAQGPNAVPQGLPPAPRTKPIASNHAGEEDDNFFLQRADSGDRRLHHGTSRDLFKGSQSGNFFNSKNGGKDDDDDYEPDYRPNAFRHSQKAKNPGPLPPFVQQYQQQHGLQQQRPVNQQQANSNNNNFRQQTTQAPRQNFPTTQPPRQNFPTTQPPRQNFPTTQPPRQNFPTTLPPRQNFPQQQQQNFPQQQPEAFAQQNNQQRKKKVTVRRKLVQKGDQDQEQNLQQKQQFQQPQQQQPRRYEEDEEYFRTYTIDQHSNVDSPNQAFGQRGNFPAIRTTIAPITHGSTVPSQTQGFPSGAPTTAYTAAAGTGAPTTVLDAARNHNYQTKARYNTIQRSRGELPTTATEYFTSPSTPPPTTTTQQKQYSLFYAKQQQQQQQQQTTSPTTPQPFQQRGSSPAAAATTANNNRFNYNTYKLTNNGATTADDYEHPEEQEFLKTAHSNNYRASDFNSFNRATTYNKDSGSNAYNTKASTSAAANQTTAATKPSSAFPVYFPTSPRPAPFSPAQTTPPPQRQATSSSSAGTTQQQQQQQTSAGFNNNNNFYSPQNAPRPFSPSPAPQSYSPTSAPSTVAAFNNQFNSRASSPSRGPPATAATTVAPQPPPKKYTAKVVPSQQASPTAAAPLKSTKAAAVAPKNDYDYAYYDDSDAGAYEYGLDPISDSHFAKTRTDSVKIKKDQ